MINFNGIQFPELPVSERLEDIAKCIAEHQVVIVAGETGSGKSTQLPKLCLALGRGAHGKIAHTQPRRIAARSVAARLAEELQSVLGGIVGYKVRFADQVSEQTRIKVLTDGMLLAEMQKDRWLKAYDTVIIDEAHERSLNIDFILGYLKRLLPRRPDLKVIITSATIDHQRFAKHFDNAPIIEVSGRTYPVEVRYRPWRDAENDSEEELDQPKAILQAIQELSEDSQGDILVFLATERDIHDTLDFLRRASLFNAEWVPLYARLTLGEQQRVFQSSSKRKIVLSTNVAETSLTVPGIRYVIDTGLARLSRYNYRDKVQQLPIERVSQASANQRAGRCGRVAPGICIRLYSTEDFAARPAFTEPEILRTNLAAVILQMAVLKLGDITEFPFVDPPDSRFIKDGYRLLHELGALSSLYEIQPLAYTLAKFPLDPRLARMLVAAKELGVLREVAVIVSGLSAMDPRERPRDYMQAADEAHRRYYHEQSDFLTIVNLWDTYHRDTEDLSQNKLRQYCRQHFLSYMRMREWREVYNQLVETCKELQWRPNAEPGDYMRVHQALLTGALSMLGNRLEDKNEYEGARGIKFQIFPGSSQAKKQPKWLLAAELVQTTKLFARMVGKIEPEWVEPLAQHLLKRHYSEPHWEAKRAQVVAYERVTLYGLAIVVKRKVHYGPIDPALARELFIRHALVEGDFDCKVKFLSHNRALLSEIEALEHKARRRDVVVEPGVLEAFYQDKIPEGIYSGPEFIKWTKQLSAEAEQDLYFDKAMLMQHEAQSVTEVAYPASLLIGSMQLPLSYHFEPGHAEDGVSVTIPLAVLKQVPSAVTEWLVPGLLLEKMTALIRALPKNLRRSCVPAPEYAKACFEALRNDDHSISLYEALAKTLNKMTGVNIIANDWQTAELEPHLSMRYRVVDESGKELKSGRNLAALQQDLAEAIVQSPSLSQDDFTKLKLTRWDFGDLAEKIESKQHGIVVAAYPALIAHKDYVDLKLVPTLEQAKQLTYVAECRLAMWASSSDVVYIKKHIPEVQKLQLLLSSLGDKGAYIEGFLMAVFSQVFLPEGEIVRSQQEFTQRLARRTLLTPTAIQLATQLMPIVELAAQVAKHLSQRNIPLPKVAAFQDMQSQFSQLFYPDFIQVTPANWLARYPVYLKAMLRRIDKLQFDPLKDRAGWAVISPLWQAYIQKAKTDPSTKLTEYRWALEEFRIALFAQELKTAISVSESKLKELWRNI